MPGITSHGSYKHGTVSGRFLQSCAESYTDQIRSAVAADSTATDYGVEHGRLVVDISDTFISQDSTPFFP